jgi:hypothetical protein
MMLRRVVVHDERFKREARLPRVLMLTLTNGVERPVMATMTVETQNDQIVGALVRDVGIRAMVSFDARGRITERATEPGAVLGLETFPSPSRRLQVVGVLGAGHIKTPFERVCSADACRPSNSVETIDG